MSGECDRCGEHAVECECHKRTPTMTEQDAVLVERTNYCAGCKERQDLIETQAREIERLREALQMAADDCQFCRGNGSYLGFRPDTGENLWDDCPDCQPFRAALAGDSHDQ